MDKKIVILGAGLTGVGAAYRLKRYNFQNWEIYERMPFVGGLAASFQDAAGFTWDVGGHVIFSGIARYNRLIGRLLGKDARVIERDAFVFLWDLPGGTRNNKSGQGHFIPYPFQNNIGFLPSEALLECLEGLIEAAESSPPAQNFEQWILGQFGQGIAKYFMLPHNRKLWRYPLNKMSAHWVARRVAKVDLKRVIRNVVLKKADARWGGNRQFKFPKTGGTGEISRRLLPWVKEHLHLKQKMRAIDLKKKEIYFADGERVSYDILISTIPLDHLIINSNAPSAVKHAAGGLEHNSISVVGVGVKGRISTSRTWGYFPDKKYPFHRITYFSNYSPQNVPGKGYYSIIAEINRRGKRRKSRAGLVEETINGLIQAQIIKEAHRSKIASTFFLDREYAYPIPTLKREHRLKRILPYLEARGVYSRGRFGIWRYEIGNMDHSLLQGIEVVEHILEGKEESVLNSVRRPRSPASTRRPPERVGR